MAITWTEASGGPLSVYYSGGCIPAKTEEIKEEPVFDASHLSNL